MFLRVALAVIVLLLFLTGCGLRSVNKAEIEAIKPGDRIMWRFEKDDSNWYYIDKVTRVDDRLIYYHPSVNQSTSRSDARLYDFDTSVERYYEKSEIVKYDSEQGPEDKRIIRIE
jgi:hypothetical protein